MEGTQCSLTTESQNSFIPVRTDTEISNRPNMSQNHLRFLARTVLVRNNEIEPAYRVLDRILRNEKFFTDVKRHERYEKPFQQRRRVSFERCKRIYNADMSRKIEFVMRKNRTNPFPR